MIFEVETVPGKIIRLTKERWNKITEEKHPMMKEYMEDIRITLKEPDIVRKSRWDEKVYLYYRRSEEYYICVVAKIENSTGFIITTYLTDKIKVREQIWKR
jgi:hypothetical protein